MAHKERMRYAVNLYIPTNCSIRRILIQVTFILMYWYGDIYHMMYIVPKKERQVLNPLKTGKTCFFRTVYMSETPHDYETINRPFMREINFHAFNELFSAAHTNFNTK